MQYIVRIPRKLKKKLKKEGIHWRDFIDQKNSKIEMDKQLDKIFNRDYSNTHKIMRKMMKGR